MPCGSESDICNILSRQTRFVTSVSPGASQNNLTMIPNVCPIKQVEDITPIDEQSDTSLAISDDTQSPNPAATVSDRIYFYGKS